MNTNNYIYPRGDHFYYLEVYNIQQMRDNKMSLILNEKTKEAIKFVSGSLNRLNEQDKLCFATFWKNKESAEIRIKSLSNKSDIKDKFGFVLKFLNREQFIKLIPDNFDKYQYYDGYKRNYKLRQKELIYLQKLEAIKNEL